MSFASYIFIFLFLPTTVGIFWLLQRRSIPAGLWALSAASVVFYIQWNPRDLLVAGTSVLLNYHAARLILKNRQAAKRIFIVAISLNLIALGYFKYLNFLADSIQDLLTNGGPHLAKIALPLGISFFTFTQIAYLADCLQDKIQPHEHTARDYILFVSFFPHLIAGPILHHRTIIPQFHGTFRPHSQATLHAGFPLFFIGLFKKVIIADHFATLASPVFESALHGNVIDTPTAWIGALAYTLQIYFDFSGYSDMAVGSALCIGMHIPFNFQAPYKSTNIIDFWRTWHISLSNFLRDYLYIPLGGNRKGPSRRYINIFITMLLGGIWHGAGLNFMIWGALHGAFITINHAWRDFGPRTLIKSIPAPIYTTASYLFTLFAIITAWVFFRAESFPAACHVLKAMVVPTVTSHQVSSSPDWLSGVLIVLGFLFTLTLPNSKEIHDWVLGGITRQTTAILGLSCGAVAAISFIFISADSPFLYFNF